MLECPTFAPILHSHDFLSLLTHIVIDEAHCIIEMGLYRPSYGRLRLFRPSLQNLKFDVPTLQLSATLPPHYRDETSRILQLKSDSVLINLGNYRPELSTVVLELDSDSIEQLSRLVFAPLEFPEAERPDTTSSGLLPKVIVYVDDVKLITSIVWFLRDALHKRGYSRDTVEVLHAALSEEHIDHVLQGFSEFGSNIRILVASEILGCGSNSKGVRRVIQYRCSGLTLSQLCQRFGRGARDGGRSVGYLLREKRPARGGNLSPDAPGTEDVGILRLIQEKDCSDSIFDWYFSNPPRLSDPRRICCNKCHSSISAIRWTWITEQPSLTYMDTDEQVTLSTEEKDEIYKRLEAWRYSQWNVDWQHRWIRWGPDDIISDADLRSIVNNATKIHSIKDMRRYTGIVYWDDLSASLWSAFEEAWTAETDHPFPPQNSERQTQQSQPTTAEVQDYNPIIASKSLRALRTQPTGGESVFSVFD